MGHWALGMGHWALGIGVNISPLSPPAPPAPPAPLRLRSGQACPLPPAPCPRPPASYPFPYLINGGHYILKYEAKLLISIVLL
jgi:hypothetical protein